MMFHVFRVFQTSKYNFSGVLRVQFDVSFGKSADEIIMDVCGHLDIPIITNFPCGHGKYQCTIPISVQVELNALKNKPYITTLESAVLDY